MPSARPVLFLLFLIGATGCDGKVPGDTGGKPEDTGPFYEEGCITIDGGGGFANLSDALDAAADGSEIALCEGTWSGAFSIRKPVTLIGAGIDLTILEGGADPAIDIQASDVMISGMTITGEDSGIEAEGTNLTVDGVKFDTTGSVGLYTSLLTNLTVSNSTFVGNLEGGMLIEGGTATITGNTFDLPIGVAIELAAGAEGTVQDNVINGVVAEKSNYKDGYGVYLNEANATISGNQIAGAGSVAVKVKSGALDASGETWSESPYGLILDGGSMTVDGCTLEEQSMGGIVASGDSVSLTNTTITTDPTTSCDFTYDAWLGGDYSCGGAFLAGNGTTTVSNVSIAGFNNHGLFILPYTDTAIVANLTDVTIDDVGRIGMYLFGASITASGVSVTNLREPELEEPCTAGDYQYTIVYTAGMIVDTAELVMSDSDFSTNAGWGMTSSASQVQLDNTTFADNGCSAIINFYSALEGTNVAFSGPSSLGTIWDYYGATILTGGSFTGNHANYSYSYDDGTGQIRTYEATGYGVDITATSSSGVYVSGVTFTDGDNALSTQGSEVDVSGNTFTGYESTVMGASSNTSTTFNDNVGDDLGGYFIYNTYGPIEANDNVVGTSRASERTYAYYTDGVLDEGYPSTYSSVSAIVYGYGYSASPCDIVMDGLEVENSIGDVISLYDCAGELSGVEVGAAGGEDSSAYVLYGSWSGVAPLLVVDGLTADQVTSSGIYLNSSARSESYIDISDVEINFADDYGIYISGFTDALVSDVTLGETEGSGVYVSGFGGGDGTLDLDRISTGIGESNGISVHDLDQFTISNSDAIGREVGLLVEGCIAEIQDNVFTGNTEYGMECDETTLTVCATNDLTGNTLGTHLNCSDDCGI